MKKTLITGMAVACLSLAACAASRAQNRSGFEENETKETKERGSMEVIHHEGDEIDKQEEAAGSEEPEAASSEE